MNTINGSFTGRLIECAQHSALIVCDLSEPEALVLHVSPGTEHLLGFRAEDVIGQPAISFVREEDQAYYRRVRSELLEQGNGLTTHVHVRKKDGAYFPAMMAIDPLRDANNAIIGLLIILMDITRESQTQEALLNYTIEKDALLQALRENLTFQDQDLRILWANRAAADSLGLNMSDMVGKHCYELWQRRDTPCPGCPVVKARETNTPAESEITTPDGNFWRILAYPVHDSTGKMAGILETSECITQRKNAERLLQQSQENFKLLFDAIGDFLMIVSDTGRILHWNAVVPTRLEYTPEELSSMHITQVHPPGRRDEALQAFREIRKGERTSFFLPLQTSRGKIIPTETRIALGTWNNEKAIFGLSRDISEQIKSEEQLRQYRDRLEELVERRTAQLQQLNTNLEQEITGHQKTESALNNGREALRALSVRLQNVREDERTNIARAIHDELGSALTGLKMDIAWLQRKLSAKSTPDGILERTREMQNDIDRTISLVRELSTELRPGVLDTVGLSGAMEWQTEEFKKRTGIRCILNLQENILPDPERSTAIFRIFQEILTNIARHAQATTVRITLEKIDHSLHLQVSDNGIGLRQEDITGPEAIGVLGMRERAHVFGGEVEITSTPNRGATVLVRIPLPDAPPLAPPPSDEDIP
ncbi:MAG: PAS domain-containing sensor histidine kinase [Spartobacteria bacterium]|nr:PAS domain-containing sensor histidine kinase [Spartobacteria bacterium]